MVLPACMKITSSSSFYNKRKKNHRSSQSGFVHRTQIPEVCNTTLMILLMGIHVTIKIDTNTIYSSHISLFMFWCRMRNLVLLSNVILVLSCLCLQSKVE
jgi:hypothetical protein